MSVFDEVMKRRSEAQQVIEQVNANEAEKVAKFTAAYKKKMDDFKPMFQDFESDAKKRSFPIAFSEDISKNNPRFRITLIASNDPPGKIAGWDMPETRDVVLEIAGLLDKQLVLVSINSLDGDTISIAAFTSQFVNKCLRTLLELALSKATRN